MFYGFERNAVRAKADIDDALGPQTQPMQHFEEGGLATSVHMPQDFHDRDVDFINTRNQHMRELVGKSAYAEGGAVSTNGGQAVTSIPTSFAPKFVPKAAAPQPRYGPLMQALMAKQAAMQKPTMPMPVAPKPAMPMPQAPTDAGPMRSDAGIPLWMQLGPGPERDAAYAQYMRAQGGQPMQQPAMQPAMQQPVMSLPAMPQPTPGMTGFGRVLQDMGAQGNMPELPAMQPAMPQPFPAQPAPGLAGFGRVLQDMGAQGNMPELPAMPQPAVTLPAMPQPVMPKPAPVAAPQRHGPLLTKLLARYG